MTPVPATPDGSPTRGGTPATAPTYGQGGDVPRADPELVAALREDLQELGWTVDATQELLGEVAAGALHREDPIPARRAVDRLDHPMATLGSLFTRGDAVRERAVAAALPRTGPAGLAALGLAARDGDAWRAVCDLRPYGDERHSWWVASDLGELATGGPLRTDHVLGIGGASATLASWTPRPDVSRALDLGTGCGVQALQLGDHARQIVATDISTRALGFAAFNAALAGQDWELRRGSMLEPVAGEQFDLIVSNPPFVITPRSAGVPRYEYRDGGAAGDAIVASLVRDVAAHLTPGGIGHFLGNWELRAGQDWREVWESWLDGTGLDAFVVQRELQDVAEYAQTWARDGGHRPGTPEHTALVEAWLDDFEARGVAQVGFGVITVRRPVEARGGAGAAGAGAATAGAGTGTAGLPRLDLVEHSGPVATPMGPAVLARLRARDLLDEIGLEGVLARRWVTAPDVTEERHARPGAADPSVILLRQGGALHRAVSADTVLAAFAGVCDGELTAGQSLGGIAALLDVPVADVIASAWPGIEGLILDGFLQPVWADRPGLS